MFLDMTALEKKSGDVIITVGGERTEKKGGRGNGLEGHRPSYYRLYTSPPYFFKNLCSSCPFLRCVSPTATCLSQHLFITNASCLLVFSHFYKTGITV